MLFEFQYVTQSLLPGTEWDEGQQTKAGGVGVDNLILLHSYSTDAPVSLDMLCLSIMGVTMHRGTIFHNSKT